MKRQFLRVCAALCVFLTLFSVVSHAAGDSGKPTESIIPVYPDGMYALFYDDGTLAFQNANTPQSGKTVRNTYNFDPMSVYTEKSPPPWNAVKDTVRVVSFAEPVRPYATACWFDGFSKLERVDDIQNLESMNITDMSCMFRNCASLQTLDLSGFETANVGNTASMFAGASKLKTVYASGQFTTAAVTQSGDMFRDCAALTGGNGTKYDAAHVDKAYARLDTPSAPGYFSEKGALVQKSFDVRRDAYAFGNSMKDFGYKSTGPGLDTYPIPPESFFLIFGQTVAGKLQYKRVATGSAWGGNCAGMAGSAALFYANDAVTPSAFGKNDVWSLGVGDMNGSLSVRTFVEAMQISQYTEAFSKARANHTFQPGQSLMPLVSAVRDAAAKGQPVFVAVTKNGVGGHALLAVDAENVSDTAATLQIYDCNFPGQLRALTIQNASAWSYDMGGYGVWGDSACSISYVPYDTLESIWENRGRPNAMSQILTVNAENLSIRNKQDEEVAKLVNGQLVTARDDIYEMPELSMYWSKERTVFLPKDAYSISTGDDITLEATMSDQHMSASVSTTADTVSFAVDDASKSNAVTVASASPGDTYAVSLQSDFDDIQYGNVTLTGTGRGQDIEISLNRDGALSVPDCDIPSLSVRGAAYVAAAVTPDGDALLVALNSPDPVTVAVSYFDKSGKFLSADLKAVSADAGSVSFALPAADTARVMLLDSDCRPLRDAVPVSIG